jgi:hypothetical protein
MTAFDFIIAAFVIVVVSFVFVRIFDAWEERRIAACIRSIASATCPMCNRVIGAEVASTAVRTMVKFGSGSNRRLRGRDYPSQLLTVACSHCSAELQFHMDGRLFCCNHEVVVA